MMPLTSWPVALLAAGSLALTGCGSTVQVRGAVGGGSPTDGALSAGPTDEFGSPATTAPPASQAPGPAGPGSTSTPGGVSSGALSPTGGGAAVGGTGTAPAAAASGPADTSPITIGVLDIKASNETSASIGLAGNDATSSEEATRALVAAYNANGGIAGRRINLVQASGDASSSNYESDLEAACAKFTQDNKVAVVLSNTGSGYYDTFQQCLSKAKTPYFASYGGGGTDEASYRKYPTFATTGTVSVERKIRALITGLRESGVLAASSKVGIIVENCSYNTRAYSAALEPLAEQVGFQVFRRDVDCLRGFSDAASFIGQVGNAVLPFRSEGVDRVFILSQFESIGLIAFTNAAEQQGYRPTYMVTSSGAVGAFSGSMNANQLPLIKGVGWAPDLDVSGDEPASPATTRCREMHASQGVSPSTEGDQLNLDLSCAPFFLLEDILKRTQGRSDLSTLMAGLNALGTAHVSPLNLQGATRYDAAMHDGPTLFSRFEYKSACSCFEYISPPSPLA